MTQRIGDIFDRCMGKAGQYEKPVIVASEFPFSMGNIEERLVETLGARGYICYPRPELAALIMMQLARYADHLMNK